MMTVSQVLEHGDTKVAREWLLEAPLEDIENYLSKITPKKSIYHRAIAERDKRYHRAQQKSHWTVTPNFWLTLIAALAAVATLIVTVVMYRGG